ARPLAERRAKTSPLRDVAGLLRSIDYAAAARIEQKGVGEVPVSDERRDELIGKFRARASHAFLEAYRAAVGSNGSEQDKRLLDLFLLEKAAYEIVYEANNRPGWIAVPMTGLAAIAARVRDEFAEVEHAQH